MRRTAIWVIALGFGSALGCSDDTSGDATNSPSARDDEQTDSGDTDAESGTGGDDGNEGPQCEEGPGYAQETAPRTITSLTGRVVDASGNALSDVPVQLCGTDLCFIGKTGASGVVMECKGGVCTDGFNPSNPMTNPAFKHGRGVDYARFAYAVPAGDSFDLGDVAALRIPAPGQGEALEAGKTVSSNGIALTTAEGTVFGVSLDFIADNEKQFRAALMNPADAPPAVPAELGLELIVGMAPFDTDVCPGAKLSVPNSQGWATGTPVEFLLHGLSVTEEWAPYAGWAVIGTGAVGNDGTTIEMDEDTELRQLSTLGIRRK